MSVYLAYFVPLYQTQTQSWIDLPVCSWIWPHFICPVWYSLPACQVSPYYLPYSIKPLPLFHSKLQFSSGLSIYPSITTKKKKLLRRNSAVMEASCNQESRAARYIPHQCSRNWVPTAMQSHTLVLTAFKHMTSGQMMAQTLSFMKWDKAKDSFMNLQFRERSQKKQMSRPEGTR